MFKAVTVEAKWIAKTDTRTLHYDFDGKYKKTDVNKEAFGVYDKASTCLQNLHVKFNNDQKDIAGIKFALDGIERNSYWFKAQFPTIETKTFMNGKLEFSIIYHYSCEEEQE